MPFFEITKDVVPKIGNALYDLRVEKKRIGQGDAAKLFGKSQSQVSLMEHNHKIPGLKTLVTYLGAIGCKLMIEYEQEQE